MKRPLNFLRMPWMVASVLFKSAVLGFATLCISLSSHAQIIISDSFGPSEYIDRMRVDNPQFKGDRFSAPRARSGLGGGGPPRFTATGGKLRAWGDYAGLTNVAHCPFKPTSGYIYRFTIDVRVPRASPDEINPATALFGFSEPGSNRFYANELLIGSALNIHVGNTGRATARVHDKRKANDLSLVYQTVGTGAYRVGTTATFTIELRTGSPRWKASFYAGDTIGNPLEAKLLGSHTYLFNPTRINSLHLGCSGRNGAFGSPQILYDNLRVSEAQIPVGTINTIAWNGPTIEIDFLPAEDGVFILEATDDLVTWTPIGRSQNGTGNVARTFRDRNAESHKLYRIKQLE